MLRINSRCWRCGEVSLAIEEMMLVEHGDGDGGGAPTPRIVPHEPLNSGGRFSRNAATPSR